MKSNAAAGHLAALFTIILWGTTFISTKVLLNDFQPVEILIFRFIIGFLALLLVYPHFMKGTNLRQELTFAAAGLCGITLYYLLENISLTYTLASNISVILSIAPFFTAILSHIFLKCEEKLYVSFFIGFAVAIIGIFFIAYNGSAMQLNPAGDILALIAAFVWGCYSVLIKKIGAYGYHTILTTRRIFLYGIIFMIPAMFIFDFKLDLSRFADSVNLFNILFLGLGASAACFVTWNFAVKILGTLKTGIYIYVIPVITVITAALILHEPITAIEILGIVLTLIGLFISEIKVSGRRKDRGKLKTPEK